MKWLNLFFCLLLMLFAAAQYNDPDGLWWMLIYAIPAFWSVGVALCPHWLHRVSTIILLNLCLFAVVVATIYYWPPLPNWWRVQVWWQHEIAREGIGVMIALIAMLLVLLRSATLNFFMNTYFFSKLRSRLK